MAIYEMKMKNGQNQAWTARFCPKANKKRKESSRMDKTKLEKLVYAQK